MLSRSTKLYRIFPTIQKQTRLCSTGYDLKELRKRLDHLKQNVSDFQNDLNKLQEPETKRPTHDPNRVKPDLGRRSRPVGFH